MGLFFIDRLITYIPTYSGVVYYKSTDIADCRGVILTFLIIILSLQTRLGEKTNILLERLLDALDGRIPFISNKQNTTEPIKNNVNNQQSTIPVHIPSRADNMTNASHNANINHPVDTPPDFNSMYAGPTTPLIGSNAPGQGNLPMEPMAANAMGSSFGTTFN